MVVRSSPVAVTQFLDIASKFLDIQAITACRFTLIVDLVYYSKSNQIKYAQHLKQLSECPYNFEDFKLLKLALHNT